MKFPFIFQTSLRKMSNEEIKIKEIRIIETGKEERVVISDIEMNKDEEEEAVIVDMEMKKEEKETPIPKEPEKKKQEVNNVERNSLLNELKVLASPEFRDYRTKINMAGMYGRDPSGYQKESALDAEIKAILDKHPEFKDQEAKVKDLLKDTDLENADINSLSEVRFIMNAVMFKALEWIIREQNIRIEKHTQAIEHLNDCFVALLALLQQHPRKD